MPLHELEFVDFFKEHAQDDDFKKHLLNALAFKCKGSRPQARGRFTAHQSGPEVYEMMMLLKDKEIESYLEVGVEGGGLLLIMDSFFRAVSKNFWGSTGLDLNLTPRLDESLLEYYEKYENFRFVQTDCFDFTPNRKFDFIFIDNNLRYKRMKKCFVHYLPHAGRYIGFHDILDRRYGAKRLWAELEQEYDTMVLAHSAAGIGMITL